MVYKPAITILLQQNMVFGMSPTRFHFLKYIELKSSVVPCILVCCCKTLFIYQGTLAAKTINASQRWLAQSELLSLPTSTVFYFRKILLLHGIEMMNFDTDKYGHRLLTMLQVGDDGWLGVERAIAQIIVRHERHWLVCRQEMVVVYLHQDGLSRRWSHTIWTKLRW